MPESATEAATALAARPGHEKPVADLPEWDLSDLYQSTDSPALAADLDAAEQAARAFAASHAGRLAGYDAAALAAAIADYERIDERLGRASSYAGLLFAGNSSDSAVAKFSQSVNERITSIGSDLVFFTLELNRLDDARLEAMLEDEALARWQPFLRDLRVFRPHQLSDEAERLLHEKEVTGRSAWSPVVRRDHGGSARDDRRRRADRRRWAEPPG